MTIDTKRPVENASAFQLKGGLFTLTAIQLTSSNLNALLADLTLKVEQAPKFFYHAPIVIDLQKLNQPGIMLDFLALRNILHKVHLVPVGVKGGSEEQHIAAQQAGLAVLQEGRRDKESFISTKTNPNTKDTPLPASNALTEPDAGSATRIITDPVRSGQQIYVRNGDLIVLNSVSHGAELLADGNIHVYGPLRGRALAGVTGDTKAHIFCQKLEAELVSIAGQYKISEDIEQDDWHVAVDISLQEGRLHIRPL